MSLYRFEYKSNKARGWRYMRRRSPGGKMISAYFIDSRYGGSANAKAAALAFATMVEGYSRLHPESSVEECFAYAKEQSLS